MPISRLNIAGLLCAFAIVNGTGLATNNAYAFDPLKVFEGEMSSQKVFRFYFEARKKGQQEEAISVLKYAADHGIQAAQWKLGRMYETGDGVERDPLAAFNLFKGITERYSGSNPNTPDGQFASDAMVALGRYYHSGIPAGGLAPDPYQARVMFTTAATVFRNANAQFELGRMNLEKSGGLHDPKLAARMLTLAYRNGHNGAKALLGKMIFDGTHFRANPVKGLQLLSQAKEIAAPQNYEWIADLQEEAFALATPEQRRKAIEKLPEQEGK
jgi:TPR repeat protein